MATGILKVEGERVVDETGHTIVLRGAGIGRWMNMENFITGYPGHEHEHRAAMLKVLGKEKYKYLFDRWLEYYFTQKDAKFFASLGLNCIWIPFNYRHFKDDMNPKVLKTEGFKHLNRVIDLDFKDHQDRKIWLWEQIAQRYKGNPWIAGYNPINEPCDPEHWRLPAFYDRIEPAIRRIDPDLILWLDGNTFAMEGKVLDQEQDSNMEGEFGPVYANPRLDDDAEATNNKRYNLLSQQLTIYDKYQIHWSIWLYKDIGVQASPMVAWNRLIQTVLDKKRGLQLDAWGKYPSKEAEDVFNPLVHWIDKVSPTAKDAYPGPWATERHVLRAVLQTFLSKSFATEFAELFRGKNMEELDTLAHSFHFDDCLQRQGLNRVTSSHAALHGERQSIVMSKEDEDTNMETEQGQ
ncbi:hypothetical protein MMC13_006780 [Lambiella insularis]|nr:hypothetical protein [Lambiella insularis]